MPTFQYCAYGARGGFANGSIDAPSPDAASELLWAQGLTPFQLHPANRPAKRWWQREFFSAHGSRRADLASFTREFATLMAAEIPLDDTLLILCDQAISTNVCRLTADLRADVLNGLTLSDAMQKQPQLFPADYISVVRAGEIGGSLGGVFAELADLLERRMEVRARIRSALVYPTLLVGLALVCLAIIMGALVPSVASFFAGSGKPIPGPIRFVAMVQSNWFEVLLGTVLTALIVIWAGFIALRQAGVRGAFDRLKLKTPLFGSLILQQETARFARTLGTLLRAGVPLLHAAASARGVLRNSHIASEIDSAIDSIREGTALHRALQNETALPPIALRMISIGEEVGKLDRMLVRVATMFEQQTHRTVDRLMTILTPLLTVVMAVLIGSLIIAVIDAVLSMNELAVR